MIEKNLKEAIFETLIERIYSTSKVAILGLLLISIVIFIIFYNLVPTTLLLFGFFIQFSIYLSRAYLVHLYHKYKKQKSNRFWFNIYAVSVLMSSLGWSASLLLLNFENITPEYHFLMTTIIVALTGTAITTLGDSLFLYRLFSIPLLSSYSIWFAFQSSNLYTLFSFILFFIILFYLYTAKRYKDYFQEIIITKEEALNFQKEMVERLSKASILKDNETATHIKRVSYFSYILAKESNQAKELIKHIYLASGMHDAGKLGIPDKILLKQGKFTEEEWLEVQTHTIIGKQLLEGSTAYLLQLSESIAYTHHEKYDGSGYPRGLKADNIPIEGRLVAISDVYDALISKRTYKDAWSSEKAFQYIEDESGKSFDPHLVKHFLNLKEEIIAYQNTHQE